MLPREEHAGEQVEEGFEAYTSDNEQIDPIITRDRNWPKIAARLRILSIG